MEVVCKEPYLTVYCSEVAACTGHHKFKTRYEALESVWRRADPVGYRAALTRCHIMTDDERVLCLLEANPVIAQQLEAAKSAASDSRVERVQQVEQEVQGFCDGLSGHDKSVMQKHVRSSVFTRYGTDAEDNVVQMLNAFSAEQNHIRQDNSLRKADQGEVELAGRRRTWRLAGRADGFRDDAVIEVKNRIRQIPPQLPLYELIQTQAYCQLFALPRAQVVEALRTEEGTKLNITDVPKDDTFWGAEVLPELRVFMRVLCRLIVEVEMQDAMLKSKRKNVLINTWCDRGTT